MPDQPKTEREEPQRTSVDEERVRGIADEEDEFDDEAEDLDDDTEEDEGTA